MCRISRFCWGRSAITVGAIVGMMVPATRPERNLVGAVRENLEASARHAIGEAGERVVRVAESRCRHGPERGPPRGLGSGQRGASSRSIARACCRCRGPRAPSRRGDQRRWRRRRSARAVRRSGACRQWRTRPFFTRRDQLQHPARTWAERLSSSRLDWLRRSSLDRGGRRSAFSVGLDRLTSAPVRDRTGSWISTDVP